MMIRPRSAITSGGAHFICIFSRKKIFKKIRKILKKVLTNEEKRDIIYKSSGNSKGTKN